MKKIVGVMLLLLAGSLFIGCEGDVSASNSILELASIGIVGGCDVAKGPAVSISVTDESGTIPITGARIRYQVNEGNWSDLEPTTANPTIIEGPSGHYNIEVRMAGHPLQTAVVFVPQDESCSVLQQEVLINLRSSTNCPDPPQAVALNVVKPEIMEGLSITVNSPFQTPANWQCNGGMCAFNMQSAQNGIYDVAFLGFPDQRVMFLENGIVRYSYLDVKIEIVVDQRVHQIVTEGVDNIGLNIPYDYGDNGCLGIIFGSIVASRHHYQTSASNMVETRELQSLRITDASSEICNRPNSQFIVEYDVKLPAGIVLNDVKVDYWMTDQWESASCSFQLDKNRYICQAMYDNPLVGDSYNIRTTIDGEEFFGSYISLDNKCIYFE